MCSVEQESSPAPAVKRVAIASLGTAQEISLADVVRAVDGPLVMVRDERPSNMSYSGAVEQLPEVWVALRAAVRAVLDNVSLADLVNGSLPANVRALAAGSGAWDNG